MPKKIQLELGKMTGEHLLNCVQAMQSIGHEYNNIIIQCGYFIRSFDEDYGYINKPDIKAFKLALSESKCKDKEYSC